MSIKDYEIIKTIGKGSFGKIYEVEHKKTKKHYALKKIETEGLSEEDLDLIDQEIKMLIQMECEYSTELIKDFRDDEYVYIILELCDSTLDAEIKRKGAFSIEKIKQVTKQLNKVFKLMEIKNIMHRDLKPENILIKYTNPEKTEFDIKLADYCLSKRLNKQNSNALTMCGTPLTMAPEILLQQPYDAKADLWSIGIIIYLMAFNDLPFDSKEYLKNVLIGGKMKKIPEDEDLKNLLEGLLKRDPMERLSWEDYFNHPFFQEINHNNYISCIFEIQKNKLSDDIQILNCYEEAKKENSVINEGVNNEKDLLRNCIIYVNDKKIGFCFKYKFPVEGKYFVKIIFKNNIENVNYLFANCSSLSSCDLSVFNSNFVKNMSGMFFGCNNLNNLVINNFNTSLCSNMEYLFFGCKKLKNLDLSNFNTSNVTNMNCMFFECNSLNSLNLSSFDTRNVTDMNCMFYKCCSLQSLDLKKFKTDKVTNMTGMFFSCSSLKTLDLSNFNTKNVTEMSIMFFGCIALTNLNCCNFTSDKVKDTNGMFQACNSLLNLDLSNFKVKDKKRLLEGINKNCKYKI